MKAVKFSVAAAAALALATAACAAENPKVYGRINVELGQYEVAKDSTALSTRTHGSRIGVKGSKDLGNGLTALYQVESAIDPVTNEDTTTGNTKYKEGDLATRNTFVGLSGSFGTIVAGNHDTPYKIVARGVGTVAHSDAVDTLTLTERRLKSAVAYIAPIEGVTLAAAVVPVRDTNRTRENDGMHMSIGVLAPIGENLKVAAGYESAYDYDTDKTTDNAFVAVSFAMGNMTIGAAYESETFDGDAMFNRVLVPFNMKVGNGISINAAVRSTKYDENSGTDETETAVGASVSKMYGKSFEAYVGFNSYTSKGGIKDNDLSDAAVGMRVYF